jgi:hypothetical protein
MAAIKHRYLIQDIIIESAHSSVYKGLDKKKDRNIVIKLVSYI